uniref:DNA_LIGASE_A3 domain-containing protein n=1 Tax=Steinernema glaseri TaxID=37863 RepID=A0A1I7ZJG8_9BILA
MDAVPWLFMERICLCLDHQSLRDGSKMDSIWGEVFSATRKKIHTLTMLAIEGKLYAAAQPTSSRDFKKAVPLDSVDLKFITSFSVKQVLIGLVPSIWKEITLDDLQKLVRFITPTTEGRHTQSRNHLAIHDYTPTWIAKKLLSMRLPVDSVKLCIDTKEVQAAAVEFFENVGSLHIIFFRCSSSFFLRKSTVDAMIDKFVPVDGGGFHLDSKFCLTRDQLERLVLKCERSDKKVVLEVKPKGATKHSKLTDFFDFDKHYSTRKLEEGKLTKLTAIREGAKLKLCVEYRPESCIRWEWK